MRLKDRIVDERTTHSWFFRDDPAGASSLASSSWLRSVSPPVFVRDQDTRAECYLGLEFYGGFQ